MRHHHPRHNDGGHGVGATTRTTTSSIVGIIELDSPCPTTLRHAASIERQGGDDLEALRHAIAESAAAQHIVTDPQSRPVSRCSVSHRQAPIDNETAAGGALADPTAADGRQGSMGDPVGTL